MTLAQKFRRLVYRLRRLIAREADNEPIVSFEGEIAARPRAPTRWRVRLERSVRIAGGFALSIFVLGLAALFALEAASRPALDPAPMLVAPAHGLRAIAAAEYVLTLRAAHDGGLEPERLFAPSDLRRRERVIAAAAEKPGEAYVARLRARRGGRDALFGDAKAQTERRDARRAEALDRLNAAIARRQIVVDYSAHALRKLAGDAADACAARAAALAEETADPDFAFNEARGLAYGWLIMLRAAALDTGDESLADDPALAQALAALSRAVERRPILFLRDARGGFFAPDHLSAIGLDLAIAAQEARKLADG